MAKIKVLHFICSAGFYGAEKWILALVNNIDPDTDVASELAVTDEGDSSDNRLASIMADRGHRVHRLSMKGRFDPGIIGKLAKVIENSGIDVLHTHGYKSDIVGLLAARTAGIACVSTPHGFENTTDLKLRLYIGLGSRVLRFFDRVIPLSSDLMNVVQDYGVAADKCTLIGNGVDLTDIPARNGVDSEQNRNIKFRLLNGSLPVVIGYIGQLIDRKNIIDLLDTFNLIADHRADVQLVIIGDGVDGEKYKSHTHTLRHKSRVNFLGYRDNPLDYLQEFDLFLMTSSLEGIPRSLMEAMAAGVPIAAYDIPGVDKLITSGKTGLLAPYGDKSELARQCCELLADPVLARDLVTAAEKRVHEHYSAQRMASEYVDVYRELVAT